MKNKTLKDLLVELNACKDARLFVGNKKIETAVKQCKRGDWMLWLAKKIDIPIKPLTLAKARCAKTVIHLMKDQRSIDAVNIVERFGLTDDVSLDDLRAAYADAAAAYAAAYAAAAAAAADADAAAYAADAAVDAAYDAVDAAYDAYDAAYAADAADAAYAAAYAADAADADAADAADAARIKNQKQTADICREILGQLIIDKVNTLLKQK